MCFFYILKGFELLWFTVLYPSVLVYEWITFVIAHRMYADSMMSPLMKPMKDPSVKVFKERKKHDRFNGMPEEEVSKRTLPDHLTQNLDIVIVSVKVSTCQSVLSLFLSFSWLNKMLWSF